jgi:hypothetical protein
MSQSYNEGNQSESEFIKLRSSNFIRKATKLEDINEHWDVLDKELGRVDVKAAKRLNRYGPVDYTVWWELRTVKRPPDWNPTLGWGVPNGVDRLIAVRVAEGYHLLKPEDLVDDLKSVLARNEYGKEPFKLYGRKDRGDLMTILPLDFIKTKSRLLLEVQND